MSKHRLSAALAIILIVHVFASSLCADNRDRFEARTFESPNGGKLLYRLLKPKNYDDSKRYPLVLFLHGAGERGDDNFKQLVHGMSDFASDEIMSKFPCFVIAPQCPSGKQWVNTPWGADSHEMPKISEPMRLAFELVAAMQKEFSVDDSRLYVTGLSMGGFGTWDAIQRHPKLFAAAVPICGGADSRPEKVKPIAQLPIWIFHGDSDTVVKTKRSRDMIAVLKKAGGKPKYTEYAKTGHNSWTQTYRNAELYNWLFAQKRQRGFE